jgi:hypothetical protein
MRDWSHESVYVSPSVPCVRSACRNERTKGSCRSVLFLRALRRQESLHVSASVRQAVSVLVRAADYQQVGGRVVVAAGGRQEDVGRSG